MHAILNTFKSGQGDCIFLRLLNENSTFNIMVDCGKFTAEIKTFVAEKLHRHINLLVITHIDNDHIDGICQMLKEIPEIAIDKIFYNCYQLLSGEKVMAITQEVNSDIDKLIRNLPRQRNDIDGKINMEQASVLAKMILSNPKWNAALEKSFYIENTIDPYQLGEGFGQLVFLSPTMQELETLNEKFAREYMRLTRHRVTDTAFEGQETLYELVSRLVSMKLKEKAHNNKNKAGALIDNYSEDRWNAAKEYKPEGISDENKASIAFVWEYEGTKVLFMGDAEPDTVKDSLSDKYETPVFFKAIKISHHGSKHSTCKELMECIDSEDFFITGGSVSDKPSLETLAKIVDRGDDRIRTIHYNYDRNKLMKEMSSNELSEVRSKYNFQITTENEFKFEY